MGAHTFARSALAVVAAALFTLPAPSDAEAQGRRRATNEVETGVTRSSVCTNLSEAQFQQMAEQLASDVFMDEAFLELAANDRPRVVIGEIVNDSHSYQLEADAMMMVLRTVLVSSRAVRLFASGADADLILTAQLTSTYLRGERSTDTSFTFHLTLTRPDGEFLGAWQNTRAFSC